MIRRGLAAATGHKRAPNPLIRLRARQKCTLLKALLSAVPRRTTPRSAPLLRRQAQMVLRAPFEDVIGRQGEFFGPEEQRFPFV